MTRAAAPGDGNGSSRGVTGERLLAAAAELFARHGYRATTLDDVARAVDIKKASLYHYIRSKEDLLTRIYDRILDRIEATVRPLAEQSLPADERLRRMIHAHVQVVAEERNMLAVVFQEEPELSQANQVVIRQRKRAYERIFERVLEQGQASGRLRELPPRLVVLGLLGMCNWLYQWYRPEKHSAGDIAGLFTLLLESGWLAGEDARRGAWARTSTVHEALAPTRQSVTRARDEMERALAELARAEERLKDGLAVEER